MDHNIRVGWTYYGVVEMGKTWCVICAKARWHEKVEKTVCLACCNIVEDDPAPGPGLQIERFIRENIDD